MQQVLLKTICLNSTILFVTHVLGTVQDLGTRKFTNRDNLQKIYHNFSCKYSDVSLLINGIVLIYWHGTTHHHQVLFQDLFILTAPTQSSLHSSWQNAQRRFPASYIIGTCLQWSMQMLLLLSIL